MEHKSSEYMDKQTISDNKLSIPVVNGCKPMNLEAMTQYSADELLGLKDNKIKQPHGFQSGNTLGGRTKGSRNKLSEAFLADVNALWLTHGNQALSDMLADSPTKFCQMVSLTVPKSLDIDQIDSVTWVINASPRLTNLEWQEQHNLIEQDAE